jgi:hypothetical protein
MAQQQNEESKARDAYAEAIRLHLFYAPSLFKGASVFEGHKSKEKAKLYLGVAHSIQKAAKEAREANGVQERE